MVDLHGQTSFATLFPIDSDFVGKRNQKIGNMSLLGVEGKFPVGYVSLFVGESQMK